MEDQSSDLPGYVPSTMVFVLHNHQPAGNFDHVFRESFDRCYRPTLELLHNFENLHASLHYTGPLLEWIEVHEPSFLDLLRGMVDRGQVEVLGGGFYEPIFCWLRSEDQKRQIDLMRSHLEGRLGSKGEGFWLAERVWETDLPARLSSLGLSYAPLDDHHFHLAGIENRNLHGYYSVSWEGHPLKIFPISKELRYLIPFRPPDQLLAFLDRNARGGKVLTYADDGEKFGVWPETYRWIWEEGYLEQLFTMLSGQSSWLRVCSMGEVARSRESTGIAVLPNASYTEMMEWALPARIGNIYHRWAEKWEREGGDEDLRVLFRGGIFENFLVKYPDVHRLYHRMLLTGALIREGYGPDEPPGSVLHPYLKSQGNDVYWHGLFGGIYLSNLRHEAYTNLLKAEKAMETDGKLTSPAFLSGDFDADGSSEFFVRKRGYNLWITPRHGGSVLEWDDRITCFHLTNTVTRHEEAYHIRYREKSSSSENRKPGEGGGIPSIHEWETEGKEDALSGIVYDARPRRAFSDGFARTDTPADRLFDGSGIDLDLGRTLYGVRSGTVDEVVLAAKGVLSGAPFRLVKTYQFRDESFSLSYRLEPLGRKDLPPSWSGSSLVVEIPLTLLAGHDDGRWISVFGREKKDFWDASEEYGEIGGYSGSDEWSKTSFGVDLAGVARFLHRPIETVSLSESGLERTFQGALFIHVFPLERVFRGEASIAIRREIDARSPSYA
jgi:hypothetical protein